MVFRDSKFLLLVFKMFCAGLRVSDNNSEKLDPLLTPEDTQSLRFNVIAEPCSLDKANDVQQIG